VNKQLTLKLLFFVISIGALYGIAWGNFETNQKGMFNSSEKKSIKNKNALQLQRDLQKPVANFLIQYSIANALTMAEKDLISFYIKSQQFDISNEYRLILKPFLSRLKIYFRQLSTIDKPMTIENHTELKQICFPINESNVCFAESGRLIQQLFNQKETVLNKLKNPHYLSQDNETTDKQKAKIDWHNFLLYYQHVQISRILNRTPGSAPNITVHPLGKKLVAIYQKSSCFKEIDRYIQQFGFRKNPKYRGRIFTAIYFDYVCKAYQNGYINMALREFLMDINGQMAREYPEITFLKNSLILLQRYKLIK